MEELNHKCLHCKKHNQELSKEKSNFYILRSDFSKQLFQGFYEIAALENDSFVICKVSQGIDLLKVIGSRNSKCCQYDFIEIVRPAEDIDIQKAEKLEKQSAEAEKVFRQTLAEHKNLEMKLVSSHILLDETKIIFLFTAEERVDFRNLVKDLALKLQYRIELWQINSREETRILGGLAICGREFCCRSIGHDTGNISMRMLKEQSLSPNSSKLSGPCGRLFCCLAYEHQQYVDEKKNLPKLGSVVLLNDEKWFVREVNVLSKILVLVGQEGSRIYCSANDLEQNTELNIWVEKGKNQSIETN